MRALAAVLEQQSERETCDPALFAEAGQRLHALADLEEAFFRDVLAAVDAGRSRSATASSDLRSPAARFARQDAR